MSWYPLMKVGDLVRVVKNDMSMAIKESDNWLGFDSDCLFFNKVGTVIKVYSIDWYEVLFSVGVYVVKEGAVEVINEVR